MTEEDFACERCDAAPGELCRPIPRADGQGNGPDFPADADPELLVATVHQARLRAARDARQKSG